MAKNVENKILDNGFISEIKDKKPQRIVKAGDGKMVSVYVLPQEDRSVRVIGVFPDGRSNGVDGRTEEDALRELGREIRSDSLVSNKAKLPVRNKALDSLYKELEENPID